jgi:hypothetical protein
MTFINNTEIVNYIKILIICIIVYLLFVFYNLYNSYNSYNTNNKSIKLDDAIIILTRQAARWSTASTQDNNPLIALLHANYGQGYLSAMRDIASDTEIEKIAKIDIIKFKKNITDIQDKATMNFIKICPQSVPEETYLTKIAKQ